MILLLVGNVGNRSWKRKKNVWNKQRRYLIDFDPWVPQCFRSETPDQWTAFQNPPTLPTDSVRSLSLTPSINNYYTSVWLLMTGIAILVSFTPPSHPIFRHDLSDMPWSLLSWGCAIQFCQECEVTSFPNIISTYYVIAGSHNVCTCGRSNKSRKASRDTIKTHNSNSLTHFKQQKLPRKKDL